ncbi:anti-sigma B factor antagonist [Pseudonocardia thermophila]|jgi:anti-anti-sigma factor|uniref:Anti-sigma factor antagonist n=1 Tax=Pseudonocardia thermophila TaxID=1848 RepID=A0A1M7B8E8_PSETH|nr:STAS domain-containing protein [Pseudonocardia thermophila]SHL51217.1 anti-sigma B factor antagonist [Pseudonocardia thermophila]
MTSVRPPADTDGQITLSTRAEDGGLRIVTIGGEVDMLTSPQLRSAILAELSAASVLVLDLEGITFLGTSGLAVLVEVRDAARAAGVPLRLVCRSRRVIRPLTIAGLVGLFDVHEDLESAITLDDD